MKVIPSKKAKGLCCACRCDRPNHKNELFCLRHRHHRDKELNPTGYAYHNLKGNAKRRGKEFKLTLKEFREFCIATGYINKKGKTKRKMSIDRIDCTKGYSIDNLQVLTVSANSRKRHGEYADQVPF